MRNQTGTQRTHLKYVTIVVLAGLVTAGCDPTPQPADCSPQCTGECGIDDGCGGVCCETDGGDPTDPGGECTDTCESAGAVCGSVCGEECGGCSEELACSVGSCVEATNCSSCELTLSHVLEPGLIHSHKEAVIAIDFTPAEGAALPRMAEFRLQLDGPATLLEARSGESLSTAGKDLYRDAFTGNAFKQAADGAYRLLAYGAASAKEIGAGRIAELRLQVTGSGPVSVHLQRREQTFAPATADAQLQASSYDQPLVVKP